MGDANFQTTWQLGGQAINNISKDLLHNDMKAKLFVQLSRQAFVMLTAIPNVAKQGTNYESAADEVL